MSIASLEAELSRQKSINRELYQELGAIESAVLSGYRSLEDCNQKMRNTLEDSAAKLQDSHQRTLSALELQAEIDQMYVRFKQMELANKKIRECNNKKYYEFANYRTVRKLVQGLMDNLDVNMVSDATIYKSIEKQHLMTPDYWLTCVLIAVMAWKNDEKELAERAIKIAMKLDKKNSSVFFMLFNLRMQRDEAALKWFFTYQECPLKGSDQRTFLLLFALLSRTVNTSEEISADTRTEINSFINKVIQANITAQGYREEDMVARAAGYYDRMDARETPAYPLLQKHCGRFDLLSAAMMKAKGNISILEFLRKTLHVDTVQRNAFVKRFIDDLIAQANDVEKEVYDEIRYNELVIRYQGEVEKAKEKFESDRVHDETELNLIEEMIDWVFTASEEDVNPQSRLNMFTLTRSLQEKAVEAHTQSYRSINKTRQPVTIGEYSTDANFSAAAEEDEKISQYFTGKRDQEMANIKDWKAYIGFGVAAVAAVASPFVNLALLIVAVLAAGFGAITLFSNNSNRKKLQMACENQIQSTTDVMHHLFEEHHAYMEEYNGYDGYVEQLEAEFAQM